MTNKELAERIVRNAYSNKLTIRIPDTLFDEVVAETEQFLSEYQGEAVGEVWQKDKSNETILIKHQTLKWEYFSKPFRIGAKVYLSAPIKKENE